MNNKKFKYANAMLFDIANDILPSAYVYNTGYWPFYCDHNYGSICTCEFFGLRCSHRFKRHNFVDPTIMIPARNEELPFAYLGKFFPSEVLITISAMDNDTSKGFVVDVTITVQKIVIENGGFFPTNEKKQIISAKIQLSMLPARVNWRNCITFVPEPLYHYVHGSYFELMDRYQVFRKTYPGQSQAPYPRTLLVMGEPTIGFSNIWTNEDDSISVIVRGTKYSLAEVLSKAYLAKLNQLASIGLSYISLPPLFSNPVEPRSRPSGFQSTVVRCEPNAATSEQSLLTAAALRLPNFSQQYEQHFPPLVTSLSENKASTSQCVRNEASCTIVKSPQATQHERKLIPEKMLAAMERSPSKPYYSEIFKNKYKKTKKEDK